MASLAPGEVSAYQRADGAYSYGALKVVADGVERRIQPIDFVGETPLSAGRYTFVIVASTFPGGIETQSQRDP